MTAKRFLLGAVAAFVAGSAWGQGPAFPDSSSSPTRGLLAPVTGGDTAAQPPIPVPPVPDQPSAADVLTGVPNQPAHPPGTVLSPWCGPGGTGCCGPVGRNGPLTYEVYLLTGPSLPVAGGGFSGRLRTGWEVGGGAKTLYFNQSGSAAWFLDGGLSYTYNRGKQDRQLQVFTPQPRDFSGDLLGPDQLVVHVVRGLHRTNFSLGLGRDWFIGAPGYLTPDGCGAVTWRIGGSFGGRWGTAHVDLVPVDDPLNYFRKSGVTQSVFLSGHVDREINFGGWIFFAGLRTEWDYTWTNLIPDHNGDLVSINLLMYAGVRF